MKQYVIDELRPEDHKQIKTFFDERYSVKGFDGLYWVRLDTEYLTDIQKEHLDCGPYYVALELLPDRLVCELLVRSQERIRCNCIQYATTRQRNWIIEFMDGVFEQLGIIT
ncbi:MAG: hypothetical protein GY874_19110 [Desulfobacteraceae bacterium]|nr:hypothetical protein [Desulfobacteraceae bacterium]